MCKKMVSGRFGSHFSSGFHGPLHGPPHLPPVPSASLGCTTAASAALALHSGPLACAVHVPLSSPRPVSANASQEAPSSASHCFVLVDGSLLPPAAPCNFHFRSTLALRRLLHWSRACLMARPLSTCSLDSPCPSPPLPKGCPPPGLFPPMAAVSVFRCSCFRPPPTGGPADACRSRCRSTIIQRFKACLSTRDRAEHCLEAVSQKCWKTNKTAFSSYENAFFLCSCIN